MRHRWLPYALACLAVLTLPPGSASAEPNGGALVALDALGVRVPFCVVPQPDSGALVLFQDTRHSATEVYVQRLDHRGRPLLGPGGALVWTGLASEYIDSFVPDGAGGCIFAWSQNRGATGRDVLVQRVLADGSLAYPAAGLVVCSAVLDQKLPQLVAGPSGSYYVVWNDGRAGVSGESDVYAQRMSLAGAPQWVANGVLLNGAAFRPNSGAYPTAANDLLGGLLVVWHPTTAGGLRAQRTLSAGTLVFGASGVALADPSDYSADIAPDGAGGLWAATVRYASGSYIPYGHHLTAAGASTFPPAGVALHGSNTSSFNCRPVRNATGGCFFFIRAYATTPTSSTLDRQEIDSGGNVLRGPNGENLVYGDYDYYLTDTGPSVLLVTDAYTFNGERLQRLQRFGFDGTPTYPGNGIALGRGEPSVHEYSGTTAETNTGLVLEAHADGRYSTPQNPENYQVFAHQFDLSGNPLWDDGENPVLAAAVDSPNDQGGSVHVDWDAGAGDLPATRAVTGYRGWRALGTTAPAAIRARLAAAPATADAPFASGGRTWLLHANLYWQAVATAPAAQLGSYSLTLPTGQDSSASVSADESFMIEAFDDSLHHWWSGALVAHSVDNLAPATPSPFTGTYAAGVANLHWPPNTEPDLAGYRLYRGSSASFVPGPANLVSAAPDTGYADAYGAPAVYKLAAVDVHGNESPYATLTPTGALAVGGGAPSSLAFEIVSRNPSSRGAVLRLTLPASEPARVAIYDANGRQVRLLTDGLRAAGEWTLTWDGDDVSGRAAASGLYFARLVTDRATRVTRLAIVR